MGSQEKLVIEADPVITGAEGSKIGPETVAQNSCYL